MAVSVERVIRALALATASVVAAVLLWTCRPSAPGLGDGPDAAIVTAAAWLAEILASYLVAAVGTSTIAALLGSRPPSGRLLEALSPRVVRRLVEAVIGVSVAAAGLQPGTSVARADAGHPKPAATDRARLPLSLDWPGLDRPTASRPRPGPTGRRAVVVAPGDSLWAIAARALGPGAGAARVAVEWPRWWAANRAIVGADPDLVRPGERLLPPRPGSRSSS